MTPDQQLGAFVLSCFAVAFLYRWLLDIKIKRNHARICAARMKGWWLDASTTSRQGDNHEHRGSAD